MDAAEVVQQLRAMCVRREGTPNYAGQWLEEAAAFVEALAGDRDGLRKAYDLQLKGMESQAELMHGLKQRCRTLEEALRKIAELESDCENQVFRLTRFQAAQVARLALNRSGTEKGAIYVAGIREAQDGVGDQGDRQGV